MHFLKVEIKDFRNLISTSILPSPSLNIITGSNGSGKSSLLEALSYLATGSSFRANRLSTIISHNNDCFTLYSEISNSSYKHRIGLKRCKDLNHKTRIDGKDISRRSELAQLVPLQILSPESISLLLEGSEQRRNFLDWALFHVEHSYHYHLSHYSRAVKQRNALLKSGALSDIRHWDAQIVQHGLIIDAQRRGYVASIEPLVASLIDALLPELSLNMSYRAGWSKELELQEALTRSLETDCKLKHTTVGPHRADLVIKTLGVKVSDTLSRGQLKLVVVALKLAQISLFHSAEGNKVPIILVDDLAAELDVEHRLLLLQTLKSFNVQLFITTPDLSLIEHDSWDKRKVFHVEHGHVKEVV